MLAIYKVYGIYYNIASVLCFGVKASGILVPHPGIEPTPPALEGEILTTGPPGSPTRISLKSISVKPNAMLCYAKSLQSCPTLCDPIDRSHQAPPSLGFSRQEHWSGLPFPSPMHESEK